MRKIILICALALSVFSLKVAAFEINVSEPGTFREIMIDTEADVSTLTISGTMNAADVEYLTGGVGKIAQVQHLIIGDLKLVESETEPYRSFTIFAEAGSGIAAKFYYSQNERTESAGFSSGLGGSSVVLSIYGTDLAGLLGKTTFPKITLPANATKVPDYMCFDCHETQEVLIADNVEEIGKQAFMHNGSLTSVNSPSKLRVIGESAFENTRLTSFVLPEHPVEIRDRAFRISTFLESINLENVTSIGEDAFSGTRINNVNLSGASVIGANAFRSCAIKELIVSDKLRVIGDEAFATPPKYEGEVLMTDLVLYEGLERIGYKAFYDTQLKSVNIPSTVTYIGDEAFGRTQWDSSLNTGAIDGIVYLGNIAYKSVNRPENIVFREGTISVAASFDMTKVKNVTLPSSMRSFYATGECQYLESATLNEGLQIIGDGAFDDCPNLKEINLPSTLEYIGERAFYNAGITSLTLPESLKIIKGDNWEHCTFGNTKITSLTLPYSLEELGDCTFKDCKSLSLVRLKSRDLNYTGYSRDRYGHNTGSFLMGSGVEKIVIGSEAERIPSGLFGRVGTLSRIDFEESNLPLSIGNFALHGGSYDAPATVTGSFDRIVSLGDDAIGSLVFPNGTHLEMSKFTSIGEYAFYNISGVTSLTFDKEMNISAPIGSFNDVKIINFDVPNLVIPKPYIDSDLHLVTTNPLDSLIIGPNVEYIGEELFQNASARSIIFAPRNQVRSASTLSIGSRAFGYNEDIKTIDLPSDLISLDDRALTELVDLTTAYFHGKEAPTTGYRSIPSKANVYVPAESEQAYKENMPDNNVIPYKLETVTFDKSDLYLLPNNSKQLNATIIPLECNEMDLIWTSSDPSVATVNTKGEVVGKNLGKATITATIAFDNMFKAECCVNVVDQPVISLNKTELSLIEGDSYILIATIEPEDSKEKVVKWSSSDDLVVAVSEEGVVTAVKAGSATITVTSSSGKTASCTVSVEAKVIDVTEITISQAELTLTEGETETLTATVMPEDATDKTVIWTSSDEAVATVSEEGVVTAVKAGTATITAASANGKTATCSVTVAAKVIEVSEITISQVEITLTEGETTTLTATILPEDATDKTVTWTSSDEAVATVSSEGVVTAVSAGTATITAASANGKTATCTVTVAAKVIDVTEISISQTELTLTEGETATLTATVMPEDATDKTVYWTSLDESIATVSPEGVVNAVKEGTTTIVAATANGKYATCTVTVAAMVIEVSEIIISQAELTLTEGETAILTAIVMPEDATDKTVYWTSLDESIATVSPEGEVNAVKAGTTTIVAATANGKYATCTVTVAATVIEVSEIIISQAELTLTEGETDTLTATVMPEDATDKTVYWTSLDESIATVSPEGEVNAVKAGTTTIVAATANGKYTTCRVTVEPAIILVESLTISPDSWSGEEGSTFTITATVSPENATDKSLSWESSNESIATVDAEGNVNILKTGTCTITVKTLDGSDLSAECVITGLSGIDFIFADPEAKIDVYNFQGILLKRNCSREDLERLQPAIYILRQANGKSTVFVHSNK